MLADTGSSEPPTPDNESYWTVESSKVDASPTDSPSTNAEQSAPRDRQQLPAEVKLAKDQPVILMNGDHGIVRGGNSNFSQGGRWNVSTADSTRTIKGSALTPIASLDLKFHNTGSALEKSTEAYTKANASKLVAKYLKDNQDSSGVPIIATDAAKFMFPEYRENPTGAEDDVRGSAHAIQDAASRTVLAKPVDPNRPDVLIGTGTPATGKTTSQETALPYVGIKYETLMTKYDDAEKLVQQVINSGRNPVLSVTFVKDPAELVRRMIKRATGTDTTPGIGRTVPVRYMARAFMQIPEVVQQLQARFGDKLKVYSVDNSGAPRDAESYTGAEPLVKNSANWTIQRLEKEMYGELDRLHADGQVPDNTYDRANFQRPSYTAVRGDNEGTRGRDESTTSKETSQVLTDGRNTSRPESPAPYKFGSTQANLPSDSEAYRAVKAAQRRINDADLMGDGKDVDQPHITVRYGIQGDDHAKLKQFLSQQSPFEAKLGKTTSFPPSPNSDGAAPIIAPVESPDLHRINSEIEKHADFKKSDFPDYKPHVTVAYVKPEAAKKYIGMADTEGKTFLVKSVVISDRHGNHEDVPLKGEVSSVRPTFSEAAKKAAFPATEASPQSSRFGGLSAKSSKAANDLASTFYSGFGDPELFGRLFPDVTQRVKEWIADEPDAGDTQRTMMRGTRGEMDRRVAIANFKLRGASKEWRSRSREDSINFWNAVEQGKTDALSSEDQKLADLFKGAFDHLRSDIQKLKPEVLQDYIENYFPHIWEQPSAVSKTIKQMLTGKRPFSGKASFLKQRTIPTMQDGLDLGFKPKSWNPVDSFLTKYAEMSQFLMGHQTIQAMKDAGTAKMVRVGKRSPDGWAQLDDRIGTVHSYDDEGHLYIRGHYYAPAEAARVFNNFVSRGMAGRSGVYDVLNAANQNMNALQLGISFFHATTTSVNAATSDIALGIQQLAEGKPIRAGISIARGASTIPSLINTAVNGSRLMREYLDPGSYTKFGDEAKALGDAGGRIKQNTLEINPLEKTISAWRHGAVKEGLTSLPGAVLHATVAPVMEYYVPRMKAGAFYAMAHDVLEQAAKNNWTPEQTRSKMQQAWDSVDNRFGQMVYDNLFWHKGLRDALNLATRSVGWNFGDIRELGGAAGDAARAAGQTASGRAPTVTPRMAFAIALPMYTALLGGVLTYLWTGKRPEDWKDYFYPKTADGQRHSIPGYMKDVVSFGKHPVSTTLNKLAPIWTMTGEAINNRDFYGTEIRHKDDPFMQQLGQFSRWAGQQAIPFSFSGAAKLLKNRGAGPSLGEMLQAAKEHPGDVALGQLGFQSAPAYIHNSEALNAAREYNVQNRPPGTKTQQQADHYDALHAVQSMYRSGDLDQAQIDKYLEQGKLSEKDVIKAERDADDDPIVSATRSLSVEQFLNVYAKGTPEEKDALRPELARKQKDIDNVTDDAEREKLQATFDKLMDEDEPRVTAGSGA